MRYFGNFSILLPVFFLLTSCMSTQVNDNLNLGNEFAKDGLYREAVNAYKKELKTNPENAHVRRNLGVVYVKMGSYVKAIKNLEISIKALPKNFQTNYFLAESYRATNQFDKAIYRYKNALEIRPLDFDATKALAWSYYKIKYYSASMATISSLPEKTRFHPQSTIIKARILIKQRNLRSAKRIITKLIRSKREAYRPFAKSILGDIFQLEDQLELAKTTYNDALKVRPYLAGALLGLGKIYNKEGNFKVSRKYLERAVKIRPSLNEGYLELAKAYEKSNPSRSVAFYRDFIRMSVNDPEFSDNIPYSKNRIANISARIRQQKTRKNLGVGQGRNLNYGFQNNPSKRFKEKDRRVISR